MPITWDKKSDPITQIVDIQIAKRIGYGKHVITLKDGHVDKIMKEKASILGSFMGRVLVFNPAPISIDFSLEQLHSIDGHIIKGNGSISFISIITRDMDDDDILDEIDYRIELWQKDTTTIGEIMEKFSNRIFNRVFAPEIRRLRWDEINSHDDTESLTQTAIKERACQELNGELFDRFGLQISDISVEWDVESKFTPDPEIPVSTKPVPHKTCHSCKRIIYDGEECSPCGHCGSLIHDKCNAGGMELCKSCLLEFEKHERLREQCSPLRLSIKAGNETLQFFLYPKSTLQFGRAKNKDLKNDFILPDNYYIPQKNDIVTRVFADTGTLAKQASLCISQRHLALRILNLHDIENLKAYDCGTEGKGSSYGTWTGNSKLPKTKWKDIHDECELCLGKDSPYSGLGLKVAVHRNMQNSNLIDCVQIKRKDALCTHNYILVYRTVFIGLGKCAVSLQENHSIVQWAKIQYDESSSSFVFETLPQSPLSTPSSPCRLAPDTVISGKNYKFTVSIIEESMFTEFNS